MRLHRALGPESHTMTTLTSAETIRNTCAGLSGGGMVPLSSFSFGFFSNTYLLSATV
jgi:hypothetical protein